MVLIDKPRNSLAAIRPLLCKVVRKLLKAFLKKLYFNGWLNAFLDDSRGAAKQSGSTPCNRCGQSCARSWV
jgi:hypothetical protein